MGDCQVEYFHSVESTEMHSIPVGDLRPVRLFPRTRCYIRLPGTERGEFGRIGRYFDGEYEVELPGGRGRYCAPEYIWVKCDRPTVDPTELLVHRGFDTPFFHLRRAPFIRSIMRQREAVRGASGYASSAIRLYEHQYQVVRRVLSDHVQRYLLADEVGLGKAIEAGAILRQYLADERDASALVLVPPLLVEQWREELEAKFFIERDNDRVNVAPFSTLDNAGRLSAPGMLIVDEAQHAASWASGSVSETCRYDRLKDLAHSAERLLLLSATPILNHEREFLAMLHLLDPVIYPLDGIDGFRERLEKRLQLGLSLVNARDDADDYALRSAVRRLRGALPTDDFVAECVQRLESALEQNDKEARSHTVRRLQDHVSETYRLHRRLIRNRRATMQHQLLPRCEPKADRDLDDGPGIAVMDALEEWRQAAVNVCLREPERAGELSRLYAILLSASGSLLTVLADVAKSRLAGRVTESLANDFPDAGNSAGVLLKTPLFEGESQFLEQIAAGARVPGNGDRISNLEQHMARELEGRRRKMVVFTEYTAACHEILRRLARRFGEEVVACYSEHHPTGHAEDDVRRFESDPKCLMLVCDRSGQEGRNLQFADLLIHFDVSLSPNAMEQRIGRLDRIGRATPVESRVPLGPCVDDGTTVYEAWYDVLNRGFGVFAGSIASLQYFVEQKVPVLMEAAFRHGAGGLENSIDTLISDVGKAQGEIQAQDMLDAKASTDLDAAALFRVLEAAAGRCSQDQQATFGWIGDALGFAVHYSDEGHTVLRYRPHRERTLVPWDYLLEHARVWLGSGDGWCTHDRDVALKRKGTQLLTIGHPLIDAISEYVRWDDRGRCYAFWRIDRRLPSQPGYEYIAFRYDFLVEADVRRASDVLQSTGWRGRDRCALQRLADVYFPPLAETVWVDLDGAEIAEPQRLAMLEKGYDRAFDRNLANERLPYLDALLSIDRLRDSCTRARAEAERILRSREKFTLRCHKGAKLAEDAMLRLVNQLRLRASYEGDKSRADELPSEESLASALVGGVRDPFVQVDAVGIVVLAGYDPDRQGR